MCRIWRSIMRCKFFICRKIEIRRIEIFVVILFLKLKLLWSFEVKSWSERIINCRTCHNCSCLLTLALKTGYMYHGTTGSGLIEIQSQRDRKLWYCIDCRWGHDLGIGASIVVGEQHTWKLTLLILGNSVDSFFLFGDSISPPTCVNCWT